MNKFINFLKVLIVPLGVVFLLPIILSILNMFGLKTYNLVLLILMSITGLISGFFIGKKAEKKGYINGLLFGLLLCFILFIISLFFRKPYTINTLLYYTIITVSSTIGSMIGIQKQGEN